MAQQQHSPPNGSAADARRLHRAGASRGARRRFFANSSKRATSLLHPLGAARWGKTTLARLVAGALDRKMFTLSAINSGVKDVREVIEQARKQKFFNTPAPFLFIDEIHRFNKAQQDSLLGAVEQGDITLVGATTENPLLLRSSRRCCHAVRSMYWKRDGRRTAAGTARPRPSLRMRYSVNGTSRYAKRARSSVSREATPASCSTFSTLSREPRTATSVIDDRTVTDALQQNIATYDKNGEMHYDIISAFIKSVRGSDPNAAVYYLARMLNAGEDPKFIARRLVILAAEDIGLANPNGLLLANASASDTVHKIGMPEARIPWLRPPSTSPRVPRANSAYMAIDRAMGLAAKRIPTTDPSPLHIRKRPTKLMKRAGLWKELQVRPRFRSATSPNRSSCLPVWRGGASTNRATIRRGRDSPPHRLALERQILTGPRA